MNMTGKSDRIDQAFLDKSSEGNTRAKIFDVSIDLFAQRGFDAVSMQEIAEAVGIKKASLYYHFSSKDQILEKILEYPMQRLGEIGGAQGVDNEEFIVSIGLEGFLASSQEVVLTWIDAPYVEKILRIIFVEMYHNDRIKAFFDSSVLEAAGAFWEQNFTIMMKHKLIKPDDPRVLTGEYLSFYSHTWLEYFLLRYGKTAGSYRQEYADMLAQHTAFIVRSLKA
jgi:AcrR family transcriptional regulator